MAVGCAKREVKNIDSKGENIICFGDSITYGYGVKPGEDYPTDLAALVRHPVINAGIDGDSSPEAIQRLEDDVLQRHPLLVIIEFGILIHFAGGLVHFGGTRLYDHIYFGIRYDKYVHFTNAFFAAITVQEIFRIKNLPINAFTRFAIYLVALGLGSGIEICEYVATLTIPHNGVGGYDDTMTDLIANSCGGALFLALRGRIPGFRRQHPVQATECQP